MGPLALVMAASKGHDQVVPLGTLPYQEDAKPKEGSMLHRVRIHALHGVWIVQR